MKVGFIGFGEVASTLSAGLMEHGAGVCTCVYDRSSKTREIAEVMGVEICNTYKHLAEESDILISSVVPKAAVQVAELVGGHVNGVYVDMNNISPKTVKNTLQFIENGRTVDASIIGSVRRKGLNVRIIASGPASDRFAELNGYGMNIKIIGDENGQASGIKMLRSAYTKGVSALLFETIYNAYKIGLDREVLENISETEGNEFLDSAVSRIVSAAFHADRRSQEMDEVVDMLKEKQNPLMAISTDKFFKSLSERISKPKKIPNSYEEVFEQISK